MIFSKRPKSGWLWLSLFCFCVLICMTFFEMFFLYPQTQRYFDNSKTLSSQPLSSRSRQYLHKSLERVLSSSFTPSDKDQIRQYLDISYSLLNINIYRTQYPCTISSLEKIDLLTQLLKVQNRPDIKLFSRKILPVLQCAELIQIGQDNKRSTFAINMVNTLNFQRKLLLWAILLTLGIAIVSWLLHLRQLKIVSFNRNEINKWIQHARQDSLTGILNRRAFDADLAIRVKKQTTKNNNLFSLLMCDIDYFKQYNDALGHVEGDNALKNITDILTKALRDNDRLYRYGGEELVVIVDNADKKQAQKVGGRILELMKEWQHPHPTSEFGFITVSIGCATSNEVTNNRAENLIKKSDKRLYIAKQKGRNCLISVDQ